MQRHSPSAPPPKFQQPLISGWMKTFPNRLVANHTRKIEDQAEVRPMRVPKASLCLAVAAILVPHFACAQDASSLNKSETALRATGKKLYANSCADCHGERGEGVEGVYETALVGDDSIRQLAKRISDTMPEGEPELCVAEDALAVASYVHYEFYSEAAQVRNRPPRIEMARLTSSQLRQSLADLFLCFDGTPGPKPETELEFGVKAQYFDGDRWDRKKRKVERVDAVLDFDFGREAPVEGVKAEEFSIMWDGGLLVRETGRYEIVVKSSCSFLFYFGADDREFINNHVQSGEKTEFRRSLVLTGGRVYPFSVKFRQRKRKTELPPANFSLKWVPPNGREVVVPKENLLVGWNPPTFALQTDLPPDDRSYGYERGIAVSRDWDESTTAAALEFAETIYEELWPDYQRRNRKEPDKRKLLAQFLEEIVEVALRHELSDEQRELFIDRQLDAEPDNALAVKRVCLVSLKSAGFLYPTADVGETVSHRVANRLSLVLFDSLPIDGWMRKESARDKFNSEATIRSYAEKFVEDHRVRAKMRQFLHSWLNLEHISDISKEAESFPGYDEALVSDLRRSLDKFLDDIVWSEKSDYRQLYLARNSFTNKRIGEYFGGVWKVADNTETAPDVASMQRTAESEQPLGVLHHPYMLSGLAYHDSTSPIHRGVFVMRFLLGRTLRPPAEAFTPLSPDLHPDLTTRERVALQTSPVSCQVCHQKINSLGFTLENFDAVGRFRDREGDKAIDTSGSYIDRAGSQINFSDSIELAEYLANSDDAQRAFVSRAFQHFVKQPPAAYGADTLDKLTKMFRDQDCNIKKLLVEIAVISTEPVRLIKQEKKKES